MEIYYEREAHHSYIIWEKEKVERDYQIEMAMQNRIPGLMTVFVRKIDQKNAYCYEITAMQPLSRMYERKKMGMQEIGDLILQVRDVFMQCEKYLLDTRRILTEPHQIYHDLSTGAYQFMLAPQEKREEEGISTLFRFFLDAVSQENPQDVGFIYTLYQKSCIEFIGIDQLAEYFIKKRKEETIHLGEKIGEKSIGKEGITEEGKENTVTGAGAEGKQKSQRKPGGGSMEKLKKGIQNIKRKLKHQKIPSSIMFEADDYGFAENEERRTENKKPSIAEIPGTQLLFYPGMEEAFQLQALGSIEGTENIFISSFPFILGKMPDATDYCLHHPAVSRLHLRIEKGKDGYCLMDLNSTNGTFLNGKRLPSNTAFPIQEGDEIKIASITYVFTRCFGAM